MSQKRIYLLYLILGLTGLSWPVPATAEPAYFDPPGLLLTWQRDPTTTMTIDWHTEVGAQKARASELAYRRHGREEWQQAIGTMEAFPHVARNVHRVELTGLQPGTTYEFRFDKDAPAYRFRTMSRELEDRLRFVVGGDTGWSPSFGRISDTVLAYDPEFIVVGGGVRLCRWRLAGSSRRH